MASILSRSGSHKDPSVTDTKDLSYPNEINEDGDLQRFEDKPLIIEENLDPSIEDLPHIQDTFFDKATFDKERFSEHFKILLAYPDGTPLKVDYYAQLRTYKRESTHTNDDLFRMSTYNNPLMHIKHFEIRAMSAFNYNFDELSDTSEFEGECLIYPGFTPHVGDMFLYEIDTNKHGIFIISGTTRISIHACSFIRVKCFFYSFADSKKLKVLKKCTKQVSFFNKERYLNQHAAFLTSEEYDDVQWAVEMRKRILNYHFDAYFNPDKSTYIRPDSWFDPYFVKFMQMSLEYNDVSVIPKLPYSTMRDWKHSLYYALIYPDYSSIKHCFNRWVPHQDRLYVTDVYVSIYKTNGYISLFKGDVSGKSYIFSNEWYEGTQLIEDMSDIERLVSLYINEKSIDSVCLHRAVDNFMDIDTDRAFYEWGLLAFLLSIYIKRV